MPPIKTPATGLPARLLSRIEFSKLSLAAIKKLELPTVPEPYKPKYPDLIFVQVKPGLVTDVRRAWNPLGLPDDLNQALLGLFKRGALQGAEPLMLPGFPLFQASGTPTLAQKPLADCWKVIGEPRIGTEGTAAPGAGTPQSLLKHSKSFRSELILKLTAKFQAQRDCIICELKHLASVKFAESIKERFSPDFTVGGEAMPTSTSNMAKMAQGGFMGTGQIDFPSTDNNWNRPSSAFEYIGWKGDVWKSMGPDAPIEVAIVDTGIAPLAGSTFNLMPVPSTSPFYNTDTKYTLRDLVGHGTAVASIIGGKMDGQETRSPGTNPTMDGSNLIPCNFEGFVPDAQLWIFNVLQKPDLNLTKRIDTIAYLRALKTLSLPMDDTQIFARLVNISISNSLPDGIFWTDSKTSESLAELSLINDIYNVAGRLCIACAGNHREIVVDADGNFVAKYPEFSSLDPEVTFPAKIASVVSVGAVQIDSARALFSNRSQNLTDVVLSEVSLLAPGKNVLAMMAGKSATKSIYSLDYLNGTSFAAPIVTGCLAKLLSNPAWDWHQIPKVAVLNMLTAIVDKGTRQAVDFNSIDIASYIERCGSGIIYFDDLYLACKSVAPTKQESKTQGGAGGGRRAKGRPSSA